MWRSLSLLYSKGVVHTLNILHHLDVVMMELSEYGILGCFSCWEKDQSG